MTNEAKTGEWAIQESGGGWDGNEWSLVAPSGNRYALFERADAEAVIALQSALQKINRVRNRIVGYQGINWSRDIYPLVAALGEAGFEGMAYDDARANAAAEVEQFKAGDLTYRDWPLAEPAAVTNEPFEEAP